MSEGAVLPPAALELLDRPLVAYLSTVSPVGRPQSSVVWIERRGEEVVLFSAAGSPKVRNLRHNPRVEIIVVDPDRDLAVGIPCFLRLIGTAEVRPAEDGIADRIARLYGNEDGFPADLGELGELVNIHVTVERLTGIGPFGDGADSAASWRED